jgi:lipoprotein-anchoring transpeptidase ErfK/SrfK
VAEEATIDTENKEEPKKKSRKALKLWLGIGIPVLFCALIAGGIFAAHEYYEGKAVPGSRIGDVDVTGLKPASIEAEVQKLFDSTVITLEVDTGDASKEFLKTSVSPTDINMELDAAATARNVINKGNRTNIFVRYLPMYYKATALVMTYSPSAIREYLRKTFPEAFVDPVNPEVSYSENTGKFAVKPGTKGLDLSEEAMNEIALGVSKRPGAVDISLQALTTDPPVPDETAQQAADKADAMLEAELRFNTGNEKGSKTAKTSRKNIAKLLEFPTDDKTGQMNVTVSRAKAKDYVNGPLTERLGVAPTDQEAIEDGNGRVLLLIGTGKNGTKVADAAGVAAQIADALENGTALDLTVGLEVREFSTTPITPEDGERWAEVDLSKQRAYFYEGKELLRTCVISSGTSKHATRTGNFKVWLKVRKQNMEGGNVEDDSYYFTPNVEWISYFDHEIAFHYAYWHNNFGHPMSHGCINMKKDDAIFSYDYLKKGDRVIVHY